MAHRHKAKFWEAFIYDTVLGNVVLFLFNIVGCSIYAGVFLNFMFNIAVLIFPGLNVGPDDKFKMALYLMVIIVTGFAWGSFASLDKISSFRKRVGG